MKIIKMEIPAAGTWSRDCELIRLVQHQRKGFELTYYKDENNTYWNMKCEMIVAYKVTSEEFSTIGRPITLSADGAFFEIEDSPWVYELCRDRAELLKKCKHYIFRFYDETIEMMCQEITFDQLKEKPLFHEG